MKERHNLEMKRLKEEQNQMVHDLQNEIKQIKTETHESLQTSLIKERYTTLTNNILNIETKRM